MEDLRKATWQGYLRQDGSKGIRNKVLVIYTVECSSFVAKSIAQSFQGEDVDVVGFTGCYDNEYAIAMLLSMIRHPNIGAVLAIGLGCEYTQPEKLSDKAKEAGKLADWLFIQECGGTKQSIEKGRRVVGGFLECLKRDAVMSEMSFADLVVGAECGGSDFTSGLAGNVLVGKFFDKLLGLDGIAIFEEIVEAIGLKEELADRAANVQARKEIEHAYDKAEDYCKSVRQYSISPGNFAGGLTTIEEKSMGAVAKSGSRPIQGVIKVSQPPPHKGLWLLDSIPDPHWINFGYTNPNDNEGMMDLISCGAHIVFLVTGRGNVVGSAVSPVIKITGNSGTFRKMIDDMDFDAGRALYEEVSLDELNQELFAEVRQVCGGKRTKAETLGHKEYYIPYKYQDKEVGLRCKQ